MSSVATAITSMEDLLSIEDGEQIVVGGQRLTPWIKEGDAFKRDSFTLPVSAFMGEIQQGRVLKGTIPVPGQVWDEPYGYKYLVLEELPEGVLAIAQFTADEPFRWRRNMAINSNAVPGAPMAEPPAQIVESLSLYQRLATNERNALEWHRKYDELNGRFYELQRTTEREKEEAKTTVARAIHTWMTEQGMEGDSPLADVLESVGLPRPKQQVKVQVKGRVSVSITYTREQSSVVLSIAMPDVEAYQDLSIYSYVNIDHPITVEIDEWGGCACQTLRARTVRDHLNQQYGGPENTLRSFDSLNDVTLSCTSENCQGNTVYY